MFVWFLLGREIGSRLEIGGAAAWLGLVVVLMTRSGWRISQRAVIGVVATVSCLLVMSDALSGS
jgi:hypothetical protein